jgi:hypothetical protein
VLEKPKNLKKGKKQWQRKEVKPPGDGPPSKVSEEKHGNGVTPNAGILHGNAGLIRNVSPTPNVDALIDVVGIQV